MPCSNPMGHPHRHANATWLARCPPRGHIAYFDMSSCAWESSSRPPPKQTAEGETFGASASCAAPLAEGLAKQQFPAISPSCPAINAPGVSAEAAEVVELLPSPLRLSEAGPSTPPSVARSRLGSDASLVQGFVVHGFQPTRVRIGSGAPQDRLKIPSGVSPGVASNSAATPLTPPSIARRRLGLDASPALDLRHSHPPAACFGVAASQASHGVSHNTAEAPQSRHKLWGPHQRHRFQCMACWDKLSPSARFATMPPVGSILLTMRVQQQCRTYAASGSHAT